MNKKVIYFLIFLSSIIAFFLLGFWVRGNFIPKKSEEKSLVNKIIPKPLEVYTIESLSNISYPAGKLEYKKSITVEDNLSDKDRGYTSYIFNLKFQPNPERKDEKSTSVLINKPITEDLDTKYPLVVMIRGYVDPSIYSPGIGTKRAAEVFVKNGFITVAPDFLGYAESDINSSNIFESRFQTYTTILSLFNSLTTYTIPEWDGQNISIWAHSNGGQIALTTLEITRRNIPTVLWAPVSKPFPYSILYYTDESADRGKLIRRELGNFEDTYDTDKYSLDLFFDKINAPIQLHQGTADDAIPQAWSDDLVKKLKQSEKDIEYFVYPNADHNLQPGWNTAVMRSLEFYRKNLHE